MQSLRDQLLKAGIVNRKQKEVGDREARTEARRAGAKALEADARDRQAAFEAREAERRQRDRQREREAAARQDARDRGRQCRAIAESGAVREGRGGPRRFHFVARSGRIPYLRVSEEMARDLEQGRYAIAETSEGPVERFDIVARVTAERLVGIDAETVRFWNT